MEIYNQVNEIETFRFIEWDLFSADSVTLSLDKIVANIIKKSMSH